MSALQAVLFDLDGVMAETERDGHRVAFNQVFADQGLSWHWDEQHYGDLLRITGGRERLLHDMGSRSDAPPTSAERETLARQLHRLKNEVYAELVRSMALPLRPGVQALMDECAARGVRLGIVTTTSRSNVDALIHVHLGAHWRERFAVLVCGEDVRNKKPDAEAYRLALSRLGLGPLDTVAIEDSPAGVAAARAADIPTVVTLSHYFAAATIEGAVAIGPGLHTRRDWRPALRPNNNADSAVSLDDLQGWYARMDTVSQCI